MPEVSRFFGIIVSMYFDDHQPPHFHASYSGHRAVVEIETLGLLGGWLPRRARGLVTEWASAHRAELMANWVRARERKPLAPILPLE